MATLNIQVEHSSHPCSKCCSTIVVLDDIVSSYYQCMTVRDQQISLTDLIQGLGRALDLCANGTWLSKLIE